MPRVETARIELSASRLADSRDVFRAVTRDQPRAAAGQLRRRQHRLRTRSATSRHRRASGTRRLHGETASARAAPPPRSPWTNTASDVRLDVLNVVHRHGRTAVSPGTDSSNAVSGPGADCGSVMGAARWPEVRLWKSTSPTHARSRAATPSLERGAFRRLRASPSVRDRTLAQGRSGGAWRTRRRTPLSHRLRYRRGARRHSRESFGAGVSPASVEMDSFCASRSRAVSRRGASGSGCARTPTRGSPGRSRSLAKRLFAAGVSPTRSSARPRPEREEVNARPS